MLQSMRSSGKYILGALFVFFVVGFLLVDSSGLLGIAPVTTNTAVATVNGEDVLATQWYNLTENLVQQESQNSGRVVSLDDRKQIAERAFEQLVTDALLRQEYKRRGITVSDDELKEASLYAPPQQFTQIPEFQTEGQFDINKYRRFLQSPAAKQGGTLQQLEMYYRAEIPKQKLFEQLVADVYPSNNRLWMAWKDSRDSAEVSYVAFDPQKVPDQSVTVTDAEIREYYNKHKAEFDRPGTAVVSVIRLPRPAATLIDTTTGDTIQVDSATAARNDSLATAADRKADSLARIASPDSPNKFDEAARVLNLKIDRGEVMENGPFTINNHYLPGVSAWTFSGAKKGDVSDLFDTDNEYYIARVDSIVVGGKLSYGQATPHIREILLTEKKIDKLVPEAQKLAIAAASSSLEQAAATQNLTVNSSGTFARTGSIEGLGAGTETIGAAFGLPIGAVSAPIKTRDGVFVMRVNRRVDADKAEFEAQLPSARAQQLQALREAKVQAYLQYLRKNAKVEDRRKEIEAANKQAAA